MATRPKLKYRNLLKREGRVWRFWKCRYWYETLRTNGLLSGRSRKAFRICVRNIGVEKVKIGWLLVYRCWDGVGNPWGFDCQKVRVHLECTGARFPQISEWGCTGVLCRPPNQPVSSTIAHWDTKQSPLITERMQLEYQGCFPVTKHAK